MHSLQGEHSLHKRVVEQTPFGEGAYLIRQNTIT